MLRGLALLVKRFAERHKIAVLTGAGISAESGIPTFRSAGGFWQGNRAEDLATSEGFARDPKMVWEWYDWRRATIASAEPNPGHHALAALQRRSAHFTLITQNVDGLHERAGSTDVLRLHGSIWTIRCLQCAREVEDFRRKPPGAAAALRSLRRDDEAGRSLVWRVAAGRRFRARLLGRDGFGSVSRSRDLSDCLSRGFTRATGSAVGCDCDRGKPGSDRCFRSR